jgi:hypothetical protein
MNKQGLSKGRYTLVTLPRIVTPYRDSVDGTSERVTYQNWLRGDVSYGLVRCAVGILPYHPFDATAKYRQHPEQARNITA